MSNRTSSHTGSRISNRMSSRTNARARNRIGPQDFEACLYPLIQREAGGKETANFWEVRISHADARTLTLHLAARFALDALEHFGNEEPTLGQFFVECITVMAAPDKALPQGRIAAQAQRLNKQAVDAQRARAAILGNAVLTKREAHAAPAARIITLPAPANAPANASALRAKGEAMDLKNLFNALRPAARPAQSSIASRQIDPVTLIQSVLDEVDANAMTWPNGRDLPHRIIVHLSQADYAYYGPRKQASEQHIAQAIGSYARECGALLECDPHVTIKVDPMLYGAQMRIETSFAEAPGSTRPDEAAHHANASASAPASNFEYPHPTRQKPAPSQPAGASSRKTPEYKPRAASMRTPVCGAYASKQAIARLSGTTFQTAVLPGDTIGCVRYDDSRPAPSITLEGPDFEFVSHAQGSFAFDEDGWTFTSLGRNGTSVQRKGTWLKLPENEPFPLEDGDCISFAKSAPLTFSVAS